MNTHTRPVKGYLVETFYNKSKKIAEYKVFSIESKDRFISNRIFRGYPTNHNEMACVGIAETLTSISFAKLEDLKIYTLQENIYKMFKSCSTLKSVTPYGPIADLLEFSNAISKGNLRSERVRFWKPEWGTPENLLYPKINENENSFF